MASSIVLSDNGVTSGSAGIKSTGGNDGVLLLQTTTSGGTATTAVTVDNAQNVGVGVTPSAWNSGSKILQIGTGGTAALECFNGITASLYQNAYKNIGGNSIYITSNYATQYYQYNGQHVWNTAASGTAGNAITFTQAMTLGSSGRLSINTTGYIIDSSEKFSSFGMSAFGNTDKNTVIMKMNSDDYATGSRGYINFYAIGGTYRGSIYWDGTNMQYSTASDQRLKTNIENSNGALEKLNSILIRKFDWKETGNHTDFGVIAQELYQVAPEAVCVGKDNEQGEIETPWGVDTSLLVPMLIKAIQEQQSLIQSLTDRLTALEGAAK